MKNERLWNFSFVLLLLVTLLSNINGNGMHNGVALIVEDAGASSSLSGAVVLSFSFAALAARFGGGSLSDRYGRRPVILIGCAAIIAGCAIGMLTESLYWLYPSRILMGIGFSLSITAATAAVADVIPESRLGEGIGYHGLAFAVAFAFGPMVAIWAAGYGRGFLFGLFGVLSSAAFLLTFLIRIRPKTAAPATTPGGTADPKPSAAAQTAQAPDSVDTSAHRLQLRDFLEPAAFPAGIITLIFMMGMSFYFSYMSLFAQVNDIGGINLFFVVAAIIMLLIRLTIGRAFDRKPVMLFLTPGLICGAAGFLLPMLFPHSAALIASGAMYGVFCGICQPLMTLECIRRSNGTRNGAAVATYYIGCDIGVGSGSLLWGWLISRLGFSAAFLLDACLLIACLLLAAFLLRPARR